VYVIIGALIELLLFSMELSCCCSYSFEGYGAW